MQQTASTPIALHDSDPAKVGQWHGIGQVRTAQIPKLTVRGKS